LKPILLEFPSVQDDAPHRLAEDGPAFDGDTLHAEDFFEELHGDIDIRFALRADNFINE
jgi:hypothetical protein